jgi:hypothetical protein
MIDLETNHEWVWSKAKFLNRKFMMQEIFQKFEDGEDISNISPVRPMHRCSWSLYICIIVYSAAGADPPGGAHPPHIRRTALLF